MKTRRGIRHQPSDKAPVSFYDVVDSFSEEEWKLLQLWQKELYNNLMKELQQAFNSLGPLIAMSVFSLKPKVKEDSCSVKLQDLDTMDNINLYSSEFEVQGDTAAESDMIFEEKQYLKGSPDEGEHGSLDVPNTGDGLLHPVRMEEGLEPGFMKPYDAERGEHRTHQIIGTVDMAAPVSFSIKSEEDMYSDSKSESISCTTRPSEPSALLEGAKDGGAKRQRREQEDTEKRPGHKGREETRRNANDRAEMDRIKGTADMAAAVSFSIKSEEEMYSDSKSESISCTTWLKVTSPVASIGINEVGVVYPIDKQDDPRGESSNSHLGKGNMHRKRVISKPFSYTDKPRLCKTSSKKLKANVIRRANKKNSVSPMWPRNDGELKEEIKIQSQSGFHQQGDFSLQKIASYVQPSEIYDNHESTMRIDNAIPCEKSTLQSPERDPSYQKDSSTGNQQAGNSNVRYPKVRYPCTECGKTLLGMSTLIMHQRIHTGERPFLCSICGKRFRQKGAFHRHQQVHTGARPYQCNVCQKAFTQKCHLHTHERTHIIAKIL